MLGSGQDDLPGGPSGTSGIVRPAVKRMVGQGEDHPTEFEIVIALAFSLLPRQGCDYVAPEEDWRKVRPATNIVTPAVSVITTISLDHYSLGKPPSGK